MINAPREGSSHIVSEHPELTGIKAKASGAAGPGWRFCSQFLLLGIEPGLYEHSVGQHVLGMCGVIQLVACFPSSGEMV